MITQDWAMKCLPQKYHESQTDWFAKRGISWHISVVARRHHEKLQSQSFVHIVENCNQHSSVVIRIMEHILRTLKTENPELTAAFFRQDNAGCYHNSTMLAACRSMEAVTGIAVSRVDFSVPQGGKGPCDRKAATIKAHVRSFVNEGNDVQTPKDLETAMLSAGGLSGIRVALFDSLGIKDGHIKWDGISLINNLQYTGQRITVWRSYDIGSGKIIDTQLPKGRRIQIELCLNYWLCLEEEVTRSHTHQTISRFNVGVSFKMFYKYRCQCCTEVLQGCGRECRFYWD